MVCDIEDAFTLLADLGAPPHLIRHHELVVEAAQSLLRGLSTFAAPYDANTVLLGAAVHDAGKIEFPDEMHGSGHRHEPAGHALLVARGLPTLARFCVSHADWAHHDVPLEDLLVALADKLWKGKRVPELESRIVARLAASSDANYWNTFMTADTVFEHVASDGEARLLRSRGVSR